MKNESLSRQSETGFTLMEILVVVIMVGVLAAIAVPGWLGLMNRQRLSAARNKASILIRDAQVNAQREKTTWLVCFKDDGNKVLSSVGPLPSNKNCQLTNWEVLIGPDSSSIKFTSTMSQSPDGYYQIQFNYDGSVVNLGKITFMPRIASSPTACVTVATLLGAIRADKDACN
ncbi:MAG: prepilin-type N-terminal cleavage/methylation domain-containing protein [Stigonema ocellatum SAG 48.90 = DSM 106950]|nr:prepilin-type N-terminal cleavage/methylation domain-containing protein [Stigonema ocellatum SAG 48.90 = DSM 106950]